MNYPTVNKAKIIFELKKNFVLSLEISDSLLSLKSTNYAYLSSAVKYMFANIHWHDIHNETTYLNNR